MMILICPKINGFQVSILLTVPYNIDLGSCCLSRLYVAPGMKAMTSICLVLSEDFYLFIDIKETFWCLILTWQI